MDVRVREDRPLRCEVESDDSRSHERLDPDRIAPDRSAPRNPRDELRLDPLRLKGRDVNLIDDFLAFCICRVCRWIVLST